ncbi:MAG: hypothetical protein F4103_00495 [Boseongicola sp. SB0673_bin_14]|nr:hypothetical protein [Boseongicola sp. SB0673_bin_14]
MSGDGIPATHLAVFDVGEIDRMIEALQELRNADDPDDVQVWMAAVSTCIDGDDAVVVVQRSDSQDVRDFFFPHGDVTLN